MFPDQTIRLTATPASTVQSVYRDAAGWPCLAFDAGRFHRLVDFAAVADAPLALVGELELRYVQGATHKLNGEISRMPRLTLPLRYLHSVPAGPVPFTERDFGHREKMVELPIGEVALVLVDVWNVGWGPDPLVPGMTLDEELCAEAGASFGERVRRITSERIVPALHAAREVGMLVAHINLPEVLRRYSQWERCTTAAERTPGPSKPAIETDWPPPAWVQGWRLAKQEEKLDAEWESYAEWVSLMLDIPPPCRPIGDELLVVSADQFHRLLRERGVKVLVYDGFWADACLVNKEGAMHDMAGRGYLCIALRDATTTREHADTLDGLWATHAAIDHIEASVGYTTTTEAFVGASRAIGG